MTKERIISVDILRGMTILLMTIVNNPGSWGAVYPPLLHAEWNGFTPTDFVFPCFIFVLGVAIPLAMPEKKYSTDALIKILARSLRIICLGLFLGYFNRIPFWGDNPTTLLIARLVVTIIVGYALLGNFKTTVKFYLAVLIFSIFIFLAYSGIEKFDDVRLPGVLQRIGIVYFFVSLIYLQTSFKKQILITTGLLLGYWALLTLIPVPGIGAANLERGTNLASWLDSVLLEGHMYIETKTWDPEGILSTLPAIGTGLIGLLAGQIMISYLPKIEIVKKMGIMALFLIILGLIWSIVFPLNKSIWSSSYVLYTAGIALLILTILHYLTEVLKIKKGFQLFIIWGVNPMIVFFLSGIIPRISSLIKIDNPEEADSKMSALNYAYHFWVFPYFSDEKMASLAYALIYALFWSIILYLFYKNKLFFKV